MRIALAFLVPTLLVASCGTTSSPPSPVPASATPSVERTSSPSTHRAEAPGAGEAVAVFAGGCFWCMEPPFERLPGVKSAVSGYTGGTVEGPSYEEVCTGTTGHLEALRVVYDPSQVDYARLVDVFLHNVDPTQDDGQFCDRGTQYRSAIFVADDAERRIAEAALARAGETLHARIVTRVLPAGPFYDAEDYHQDFHRTHPMRYQEYRLGCGRDARLRELWGSDGH